MKNFLIFTLIFLHLPFFITNGQRPLKLSLSINDRTEHVSYYIRNGMTYASSRDIGRILSGNYFYNDKTEKIELKFLNNKLKITGKNQFVVLTSKSDNRGDIYQLPVSTLLIKNDIFIPLDYALPYISMALEKELIFDDGKKHIYVTGKDFAISTPLTPDPEREKISDPVVKVEENKLPIEMPKYDIYAMEVEEKTNGTLIRLKNSKPIKKPPSSIQENTLYLFLSAATLAPGMIKETETSGFVRRIKSKIVKGNPQFEFLLRDGYVSHEVSLDPDSYDILVTIHNEVFSKKRLELEEGKNRWAFNVVVIDPGHGGRDPGASGVSGAREKDINLKIGLKLGKLIEKNLKDVKVVYTRKTDEFVELYKRGKIANEADGNLFISIHCNSLKKKPSVTKGFEVYLLRPGRTEEAISIAEFENSVIEFEENPDRYQELTDENFILVSMAHSSNMRYSEKFSDLLNHELSAKVKTPSRGIKQAGFYVLVGASMPGILFESGFLSNKEDEKYLKSDKGQQDIAQAMFNAVKSYKIFYDESFKEETL